MVKMCKSFSSLIMYAFTFIVVIISSGSINALNWNQFSQYQPSEEDQIVVDKKSEDFVAIGCSGVFDPSTFARLERLCEECYQLYRLPDMFATCRSDCFKNDVFPRCIEALMVTHEKDKLMDMVHRLNHGRSSG